MKKKFITMILSAGLSTRFNGFKPLAKYKNKTFLENIIEKTHSFSDYIFIITGYNSSEIECFFKEKNPYKINLINNPDFENGMYNSFIKGIKTIDLNIEEDFDLMFQPVDIPHIDKHTYNELFIKSQKEDFEILKPSFQKKGGHPVILSSIIIKKILENYKYYSNPKTLLKNICNKYSFLNTSDRAVIEDFDHSKDILEKIKQI